MLVNALDSFDQANLSTFWKERALKMYITKINGLNQLASQFLGRKRQNPTWRLLP
jgi:hypothetical protein